jgi:uncharacterized protein (TIGR02246 family)
MTDSDYDEIRQLVARYSQTLDFGDAEGFAACFVEDGVLDTSAPEDGLTGVHRGRDALQRYAAAAVEYTAGRVRQSCVNLLIEGDGATAKATSYVIVTRAYDEWTNAHGKSGQVTQSDWETTGMCFDELVKHDGRWLFATRQFRHDGLPDVLQRTYMPVTIGPRASG